jgi:hypothetical protein
MKIPNSATNSLVAGVLMLGLSMASAQDIANPPDGELQKVELAAGLSQYGMEFDDPLALIAAARIYKSVSGVVKTKDGQPVDVEKMLASAEALAKGERTHDSIVNLVADARTATKQWVPMTCWQYEYVCHWGICRWQYIYYPC